MKKYYKKSFFDFKIFIYKIKNNYMRRKVDLAITIEPKIFEILGDHFYNKSLFIEQCIIKELSINNKYKEIIEKMNLKRYV